MNENRPSGEHRMSANTSSLANRLKIFSWTKWRVFFAVAGPLLGIYLATTMWGPGYGVDAVTHLQTAYHLVDEGTVFVEGDARLPAPWMVVASDARSVSQYPPGAAALAVPLYVVWPGELTEMPRSDHGGIRRASPGGPRGEGTFLVPPLGPGAILAALTTAIAIGLLAVVFFGFGGGWTAVLGGLIAGLGTAAWSVSAAFYWHHGPAMMWLAAGMLMSVSHEIWSGLAFGAAGLTRPHTLVVAAATGVARSIADRRWKPVVLIGLGSTVGLVLLLVYNEVVFGTFSVFGGYGGEIPTRVGALDLGWYGRNLLGALLSPQRGMLVYSPFLIVLLPGLLAAWRAAPAWVRGAAVGGVIYLLIQYKLNRFNDGSATFGYRYPLEALVALAPLLFLSYTTWVKPRWLAQRIFVVAITLSIAFQFVAALDGFG